MLKVKRAVVAEILGEQVAYNQNDATGFIALNALRLKASARQKK